MPAPCHRLVRPLAGRAGGVVCSARPTDPARPPEPATGVPESPADLGAGPASPAGDPAQAGSGPPHPEAPRVLAIAGTDSSCGAGLAVDLAVLSSFGVSARVAVTAVTAQSPAGARVWPQTAAAVAAQIEAGLASSPQAIKIGMLARTPVVHAVRAALADTPAPIVLDPVLATTTGTPLLDSRGRHALLRDLFPRSTLVTPNLPEAATLLGIALDAVLADPLAAARALLERGARFVLLKGGHAPASPDATVTDWLVGAGPPRPFQHRRVPLGPAGLRGTGCALSSAIAARLARGEPLPEAVRSARDWLQRALEEVAREDPVRLGRRTDWLACWRDGVLPP